MEWLTGDWELRRGILVVDGEGAPVVLKVDEGVYEVRRSSGMTCV
jgi:hypothetical protein